MQTAVAEPAAFAGMLDDQLATRLLYQRIIVLGTEVDDRVANRLCAQLLLLSAEDPRGDISLYINSPGGSVSAGLAIYDTMQLIPNDVSTLAMGLAGSMGQFLLCAGAAGKRFSLPHAQVLMHQGSAGFGGTAADVEIYAEQLERTGSDDDPADLEAHRAAGGDGRAATACGTAGSAPRRPATTGSSTTSWSGSTTCARASSAGRRGCDHEPVHDPHRGREDRGAASGPTTSTPGCCRSGSSSSAPRSTTASPTWSWPSCCTSSRPARTWRSCLYINSPGGSYSALTAIYDTMQYVQPDVATICMGQAASAAAVLLAAGAPGKRSVLRHAKVLLHQPSSQARGTLPDLAVQAKEVARVRAEMDEILSRHTGHPVDKIRSDTDRNMTLSAREAVGLRPGRPGHHHAASAARRLELAEAS